MLDHVKPESRNSGMESMHRLFQKQLSKATKAGDLDIGALAELVVAAYDDAERDRVRTNRSLELMSDELHQANSRLLEAFDVVPEGLVLLDRHGRYVLFNRRFVEIYHVIRDKIVVGADFAESVRAGVERGHYLGAVGREEAWLAERLGQNGLDQSSCEQHIQGDRWIRIEERRTKDGGSIGVRIDITDLKRREAVLTRRSEQLIEAQRLGKIGDWSFRFDDSEVWWSPQVFDLLGYDPAGFRPTRAATRSLYEADSLRLMQEAQAMVRATGAVGSVDVRLRRGDGSIGDFILSNKLIVDSAGQPAGLHGTIQDISERKSAERAMERLAFYDPLTGVANRALFQRHISDLFHKSVQTSSGAALLVLDLDRFKEVNDSLGHAAGDQVLIKVAHLISRALGPAHFFARLGGDEFAVVAPGCADCASVEQLATDVIAALSQPILIDQGEVTIGTSIGIAMLPRDGSNLTDLQRNADIALYCAKEAGRGRFRHFDARMSDVALHKIQIARELRRALQAEGELDVHYQPQVDLLTDQVIGYEALLRWTHPTLGSVPPSEFIPIAESSQLICDLGLWILRRAVRQAKAWIDAGERPREVSVNVSPAQIWQTNFAEDVAAVLQETALPPSLLCLELTESLLVDHSAGRVRSVLSRLKSLGVTLALDDFGTDYSSLGYLTQLPFDKLKIDRIFVNGIATSARARNLLEGIVALGRGLGMTVVVEGVELPEEIEIVRRFHADLVQGYAFARPTPPPQALLFARSLEAEPHRA